VNSGWANHSDGQIGLIVSKFFFFLSKLEQRSDSVILSLHVWRKTLCGGMPVVIPTTTKSTTAKRRRKSRNRGIGPRAVFVSRLVANRFLRGWQYNNLLLACTAALSQTALDAPEN
jgi:hypothetical protein